MAKNDVVISCVMCVSSCHLRIESKNGHFEVVHRLDARNYAPDVEKYRAGDHRPCLISLLFLHPKESFPCLLVGFS